MLHRVSATPWSVYIGGMIWTRSSLRAAADRSKTCGALTTSRVARTIARSPVPTISGVGHEVDFTIADFVADLRAPTPSAAAELITPDQDEIRSTLDTYATTLEAIMADRLQQHRLRVQSSERALAHLSPRVRLANARQRLDEASSQYAGCRAAPSHLATRANETSLKPSSTRSIRSTCWHAAMPWSAQQMVMSCGV